MAASKITYTDKVGIIPKEDHINQVWDDDMNEIKRKVNDNADLLDALEVEVDVNTLDIVGLKDDVDNLQAAASIMFNWKFSTNTTATIPSNKTFKFNNSDPSLVTEIYVNNINNAGTDTSSVLAVLKAGNQLYIQVSSDSTKFILATINTDATDNGGWFTIQVTINDSGVLPSNNSVCGFLFLLSDSGGGAASVSPLTTKGDLYTYSTEDARLGIGTNGQVLTADSNEATGIKWVDPVVGITQQQADDIVANNAKVGVTNELNPSDIGVTVQGYNANTTIQGNTFNGNSQLVKTTADGKLPALDGSLLTNIQGSGTGGNTVIEEGDDITITGNGSNETPYNISVTPPTLQLGDEYLGGIIFHLYKGTDGLQHGLVCSKTQSPFYAWQSTISTTGAWSSWDGLNNTSSMINSPIKDWVTALGTGWYIPSADELMMIFNNRYTINKGISEHGGTGVSLTDYYWSSTEQTGNNQYAYMTYFLQGVLGQYLKTSGGATRAVRKF